MMKTITEYRPLFWSHFYAAREARLARAARWEPICKLLAWALLALFLGHGLGFLLVIIAVRLGLHLP